MHLLVIGSGGREHALAWKLAQSDRVTRISVAPGNAGMQQESKVNCVAIQPDDFQALAAYASDQQVHLTIVGPETPLVNGIVDLFETKGLRIFGPHKSASRLEGSKAFAKAFMQQHGIPTASYEVFEHESSAIDFIKRSQLPLVIKADGLAAGKGVTVAHTADEAVNAVSAMFQGQFGKAGSQVVIEQFLSGQEASFIVLVSGRDCVALATSQDHKARDEGDTGPNTGGMGAYSPAPVVTSKVHDQVMTDIVLPTINALADTGQSFTGFLYVGLMIDDADKAKVVEFNVRLGDPETQPLMLRLKSDLLDLLDHAVNGTLTQKTTQWHDGAAIGVVLAASEYPSAGSHGQPISGIEQAEALPCKVFHSGTSWNNSQLVTNGGRVLCVTALGENLPQAKQIADKASALIHWSGVRYRRDIGHRALN